MWVVAASPRMNAMLPDSPAVRPVDGFDVMVGARTKKGLLALGAADTSSGSPSLWTTRRHKSPTSMVGAGGAGAGSGDPVSPLESWAEARPRPIAMSAIARLHRRAWGVRCLAECCVTSFDCSAGRPPRGADTFFSHRLSDQPPIYRRVARGSWRR